MFTLLKHDIKATAHYLIILLLADVLVSLLWLAGYQLHLGRIYQLIITIAFVMMIMATCILPTIVILIHYYQSLYGRTGYLTHTLPLGPLDILDAKIWVAVFWSLIQAVFFTGMIFLFLISRPLEKGGWEEVQHTISTAMAELLHFLNWSDFQLALGAIALTLTALISVVSTYLFFYLCFSLAHRLFSARFAILGALIIYVVAEILLSVLSLALAYFFPYVMLLDWSSGHLVIDPLMRVPFSLDLLTYASGTEANDLIVAGQGTVLPVVGLIFGFLIVPINYVILRYLIARQTNLS